MKHGTRTAVRVWLAPHVRGGQGDERPGPMWTVTDLARASGVARATLQRWLAGEGDPNPDLVAKVAGALGVPVPGRAAARAAPGRRTAANPTERPRLPAQVTDDLPARSAAELRLMLRGAMMGGAQPDRLLELLDALERALGRERPR